MHSTVNQLRQHADHHATQRKHARRFRVQSHHSQNGRPEAKAPKSSSRERDHDQEGQENVLRFPGSRSQSGIRRWTRKSTRLINSSAPTRSSPGKISRTPRCIRTRRWSGVCGKVAKECGDRWAGRCRVRFRSRRTPEHTRAADEVICGLLSRHFRCYDHAVWASHWTVVEN